MGETGVVLPPDGDTRWALKREAGMESGVRGLGDKLETPDKNCFQGWPHPTSSLEQPPGVLNSGLGLWTWQAFLCPHLEEAFPHVPCPLSLSSTQPQCSLFRCDKSLPSPPPPPTGIFSGKQLGLIYLSIPRAASWP